ncbi:MAG: hypothetical protein ACXIUZ_03450 [Lysobacteraceae bacterium]
MKTRSMSATTLVPTTLALALALAGSALAEEAKPDARALVDAHIAAVGGAEALKAQSSGTVTGRFEMPAAGIAGPMTIYAGGPERIRTEIEMTGFGMIRSGINGEVVWSEDPFMGPRILEGEERALQVESVHPDAAVRADSMVASLTTEERAEYGGQACWKVRVEWRSGRTSHDCYAVDGGLLVATVMTQTSPMGEMTIASVLSDYKEFDGVKVATRTTQEVMGQQQVITIESIELGEPDPSVFEMPAAIQALAGE